MGYGGYHYGGSTRSGCVYNSGAGCFTTIAAILLAIIIIPAIYNSKARPGSQIDYRGKNYKVAERTLSEKGFNNITCIPKTDLSAKESALEDTVIEVRVDGSDKISGRFSKSARVEIYYHKMPENPIAEAPGVSADRFKGKQMIDVYMAFIDEGFTNISTEGNEELDTVWDGNDGKVYNITIAGDNEWLNEYHQKDEVIIYYRSPKANAQAKPPEGNSSHLIGKDYKEAESRFIEAGFTNVELQGYKRSSYTDSGAGKVFEITVDGENNWSYGIGGMLRKSYERNVPVLIMYYTD